MQATATRRTQAERREATTSKLLDATIGCLAELGYARTSVAAICASAGVSQGALFRHFATRRDVIVAAADAIGREHIEQFDAAARGLKRDAYRRIVLLIRGLCRTQTHAAWREIMVAARTDAELRVRASQGLERFESMLIATSGRFLGLDGKAAKRAAVVLLSIMHMFDSEAMTIVVFGNEPLETQRIKWATEMLKRELSELSPPVGATARR